MAGISLSKVDLPAPECPAMKANSPYAMNNDTDFSASWPPG